jgi:hypothetical protein
MEPYGSRQRILTGAALAHGNPTFQLRVINGTGPDGSEVALAGTTADVATYDAEHGWRYVIDNPFGTA